MPVTQAQEARLGCVRRYVSHDRPRIHVVDASPIPLSAISEENSRPNVQPVTLGRTLQDESTVLSNVERLPRHSTQISREAAIELNRYRQCLSLDEQAMYGSHYLSEASGATSATIPSSCDIPRPGKAYSTANPIQPLYKPPERVKTPEGVPSWKGEVRGRPPALSPRASTSSFANQLRTFRRVLRRYLRGAPLDDSNRIRSWRPPVSGHGVIRCGEELHPFVTAAAAHLGPFVTSSRGSTDETSCASNRRTENGLLEEGSGDTTEAVLNEGQPAGRRESSSGSRNGNLSQSQRALLGANDNAIPVSSHRATARRDASNTFRSVSVPRRLQVRPISGHRATSCHPDEPIETVDIINAFPSSPELCEDGRGQAATTRVAGHIRQAPRGQYDVTRQQDNSDGDCEEGQNTSTTVDRLSIRRESQSRYRCSGVPVYDTDVASLRSLDEQAKEDGLNRLCFNRTSRSIDVPGTFVEGCGNSCVSRASTAHGTQAVMSDNERDNGQRLRAVANGASRFFLHGEYPPVISTTPHSTPSGRTQQAQCSENCTSSFDLTPVTITHASRTYCDHQIAKLRKPKKGLRKQISQRGLHVPS